MAQRCSNRATAAEVFGIDPQQVDSDQRRAANAINFGLILLYDFLLPARGGSISLGTTLFFIFLLTLIVLLFDQYYPMYFARFKPAKQ